MIHDVADVLAGLAPGPEVQPNRTFVDSSFSLVLEKEHLDPGLLQRSVDHVFDVNPSLRAVLAPCQEDRSERAATKYSPAIERWSRAGHALSELDGLDSLVTEAAGISWADGRPAVRVLHTRWAEGGDTVTVLSRDGLDGPANGLLLEQLSNTYSALLSGVNPEATPRPGFDALTSDYPGNLGAETAEVVQRLSGFPTVLDIPHDGERPSTRDAACARVPVDLGDELSTRVRACAQNGGPTPFAILLAAWAVVLGRQAGARSLLVGVCTSERLNPNSEQVMASVTNLLPVPIDLDSATSTGELIETVQSQVAWSLDRGRVPFRAIADALAPHGDEGRHPVVQARFGMHDESVPHSLNLGSAEAQVREHHGGRTRFDLTLFISRSSPTFSGTIEFATGLWNAHEIGLLADGFVAATADLIAGERPLGEVRAVGRSQRALLSTLHEPAQARQRPGVAELVVRTIRNHPDSVAVRDDRTSLTYGELGRAITAYRAELGAHGVRSGARVLIGVAPSVNEVVALTTLALCGATYIGVDARMPPNQLRHVASLSAADAAIGVDTSGLDDVVPVPSWSGMLAETASLTIADAAAESEHPVYLAFTSGSTGQPKGVSIPVRAVSRLIDSPDFCALGPHDKVLRFAPLAFDASTFEVWAPLAAGACIEVLANPLPTPTEMEQFFSDRAITMAWLTAGLFRTVWDFAPQTLAGVRQLITGGDVVPPQHVIAALNEYPGLKITNGYGPTENTTFSLTHTVTLPELVGRRMLIGSPISGTSAFVLDDHGYLLPPGAVGELALGGDGLALGYVGGGAQEDAAFCTSPDVAERIYRTGDLVRMTRSGALDFLGRRDEQVKLRGFRVELGAIQKVLGTHPGVKDSFCFATETDAGKQLVAAVLPAVDNGGDLVGDLVQHLRDLLPDYMVPALWAFVDSMPTSANGKVDRKRLASMAVPAAKLSGARRGSQRSD